MSIYDGNLQLDSDYTYATYAQPPQPTLTTNISGDVNIVTTINGATGPITFSSPDGFAFTGGTGGQVVFTVSNPATARAALGAAASGANSDITSLSGLTTPLSIAQGGTAAITAAAARTSLSVPRIHSALVAPAATDDGAAGFPVGSLWVDTVLGDGYISVDASAGAAVWKVIT